MCDHPSLSRAKQHMDFELFKQVVDDGAKRGVAVYQLSFYGEPLLYHQLVEATQYISKKVANPNIIINTNGFYLTEELAAQLIDAGITLFSLSIDGNNKEEFEKIRIGLKWDTVRNNVASLRRLIDEKGSAAKVHVRGLHLPEIRIDEVGFKQTWGNFAHQVMVRNDHELCRKEKEGLVHKVFPCNKIFNQMIVMANGDVTICAFDWQGEMKYGNVQKKSIGRLWMTPSLLTKRSVHALGLKKAIPFCRDCSYRAF